MNNFLSKASNLASSAVSSLENSSYLKQHNLTEPSPSEYIDAQTAKERMLALPLPATCTWVNAEPDSTEPLTLKMYSVWNIFKKLMNFLVMLAITTMVLYGTANAFTDSTSQEPQGAVIIFLAIFGVIFGVLTLAHLYQFILSFYPKLLIFNGEQIILSRGLKWFYRDKVYNVHTARIRANVDQSNQNSNDDIATSIVKQIFKNYHIRMYEADQNVFFLRRKSNHLITVKSLMSGFKCANFFCDLLLIQRLVKK